MLTNIFSMVMLNAETVAYNDVFRLCAIVFIVSVPSVFLLRGGKPNDAAPVMTE